LLPRRPLCNRQSNRPGLDQLGKSLKAAVVGSFHRIRETTARKLAHAKVVLQAFAANALSRTPAVAAIAPFQVGWLFAFHNGQNQLPGSQRQIKLIS
jgi:hypothetical protein